MHEARRWTAAAESKIEAEAIVVCVHVKVKVAVVDAAGDEGGGGGEARNDDNYNNGRNNHTELLVFACSRTLCFHVCAPSFDQQNSLRIAF